MIIYNTHSKYSTYNSVVLYENEAQYIYKKKKTDHVHRLRLTCVKTCWVLVDFCMSTTNFTKKSVNYSTKCI